MEKVACYLSTGRQQRQDLNPENLTPEPLNDMVLIYFLF